MPKSFRYYDFLMNYIRDNMDLRKVHFYGLKKSMQAHYQPKAGFIADLIGLKATEGAMSYRDRALTKKRPLAMDHRYIKSSRALQRSNYVQLRSI